MTPSDQDVVRTNYWMRLAGVAALSLLSLFLLVATLYAFKSFRYIGSGVSATNTISVTGSGDIFAVPDVATFNVAVLETAKDVKAAQDKATQKNNDIVAYLKQQGIEDKDVQTTDYSVNPQYEYQNGVCTTGGSCSPGKQVMTGFQVSQTLTVKVRDTKKAGDILSGVGSRGVSSVSGLSFTVADEETLKAKARDKAIQEARTKADTLARSLGVSIIRVVGFNEDSNYPIMYGKGGAVAMDARSTAAVAPAPDLPTGQNKITSNVNITYEIR